MFKTLIYSRYRYVLASGVLLLATLFTVCTVYTPKAYADDSVDSYGGSSLGSISSISPISSIDSSVNGSVSNPTALLKPVSATAKDKLNKAGIYSVGGKLLVDRAVEITQGIKTSSITTSGITVDSITINFVQSGISLGNIVQIVFSSNSAAASSTSSSYADTGLNASITPKSSSDKILVFVSQQMSAVLGAANSVAIGGLQLVRSGSTLFTNDRVFGDNFNSNTQVTIRGTVPLFWQDSPATTSAITYKTQFNRLSGADGTINVQESSTNTSFIVLVETK